MKLAPDCFKLGITQPMTQIPVFAVFATFAAFAAKVNYETNSGQTREPQAGAFSQANARQANTLILQNKFYKKDTYFA